MEEPIRAAILRTFSQCRQRPEQRFDESRFLHFLMADGRTLGAVRNSFAGLRRLNAFYDRLQLECAVCFDVNTFEKDWPIDKLASLIAERKRNSAAQRQLVRKRSAEADRNVFFEPFKFGLILIAPAVALAWAFSGGGPIGWTIVVLGVVADFALYLLARREARYFKTLRRAIEG